MAIEDFYKDAHRKILETVGRLVDRGVPVELLAVSEELRREGRLEDVGGAAYLSSLMDGVPRSSNVEYYARIIKEKACSGGSSFPPPRSSPPATRKRRTPTIWSTPPRRR